MAPRQTPEPQTWVEIWVENSACRENVESGRAWCFAVQQSGHRLPAGKDAPCSVQPQDSNPRHRDTRRPLVPHEPADRLADIGSGGSGTAGQRPDRHGPGRRHHRWPPPLRNRHGRAGRGGSRLPAPWAGPCESSARPPSPSTEPRQRSRGYAVLRATIPWWLGFCAVSNPGADLRPAVGNRSAQGHSLGLWKP